MALSYGLSTYVNPLDRGFAPVGALKSPGLALRPASMAMNRERITCGRKKVVRLCRRARQARQVYDLDCLRRLPRSGTSKEAGQLQTEPIPCLSVVQLVWQRVQRVEAGGDERPAGRRTQRCQAPAAAA